MSGGTILGISRRMYVNIIKILAGILLSIIMLTFVKELFLFLILTAISFVISYFINRIRLPFDISPVPFLSVLISLKMGFVPMVMFVIIGSILPSVISGAEISANLIIYLLHLLVLNLFIVVLNPVLMILVFAYPVLLGISLVSVNIISNAELVKRYSIPLVAVIVNLAYFINFGGILSKILG